MLWGPLARRRRPAGRADGRDPLPPIPEAGAAPRGRERVPALDAARALGVLAMVAGHTLDAVLSPAVRATPAAVLYWKARGLTAPLFLLVAGWAVSLALSRSDARGLAALRSRLPRVALLFAIGVALRFPGWDVDGLRALDPTPWAHLLGFDALHAIAASIFAVAAVWSLPLSSRERALALALLGVLAVALAMRDPGPPATGIPAIAVQQAFGGTSPFPVFPWAVYFLAGATLGIATERWGRRAVLAAGAGGLAVALALVGLGVGTMPPAHPVLVAFRIGAVLAIVAALTAIPVHLARAAAPLGRASLGVYAIHLPIVYGWSTYQGLASTVGPTLGIGVALGAAALVFAASLALLVAFRRVRGLAGAAWARRGDARDAAAAWVGRISGALRPR